MVIELLIGKHFQTYEEYVTTLNERSIDRHMNFLFNDGSSSIVSNIHVGGFNMKFN